MRRGASGQQHPVLRPCKQPLQCSCPGVCTARRAQEWGSHGAAAPGASKPGGGGGQRCLPASQGEAANREEAPPALTGAALAVKKEGKKVRAGKKHPGCPSTYPDG